MNNLNETFFKYFKEISLIPRKSGNEFLIFKYLENFAKEKKLKYYIDELFNIIIYKEASKGYEKKETLAFQSHTDMICEKANGVEHDFLIDPINIYIEKDYIKAKGTTLGADNGVGVAYMLAILESNEILSPALECIFTSQEETTMNGARYIDETKISATKIISFDNFSEDGMWVSSAYCKEYKISINNEYINLKKYNKYETYELCLKGFIGGHSGLDIDDEKRGNPIKLAVNIIDKMKLNNLYINNIKGGNRVNIIPRDCKIIFSTDEYVKLGEIDEIKEKYGKEAYIRKIDKNVRVLKTTSNIIHFIKEIENGVIKKDKDKNVILSANLGVAETKENETILKYSVRINNIKLGNKFIIKIEEQFKNNKFSIIEFDEMLGYESKENSKLVEYCYNEYFKTFGKNIKKIKVQACLECGFFATKIKDLEYISIGPNIYNAHSPSECFSISSSKRMWKYIINILKNW